MGTRVTIAIWGSAAEEELRRDAAVQAFDVFAKLDARFSTFRYSSEISRVNQQAGMRTEVSADFLQTFLFGLEISKRSCGAFDPWLRRGNGNIHVDCERRLLKLPAQSAVDLNSIVKGLAIDRALACFPNSLAVMIEAGGDIAVKGNPPQGQSWRIGVRNPQDPKKLATIVPLADGAICTSGEYFRGAHLRRSGALSVSAHATASMTVAAPQAKLADALSTAAYNMPVSQALEFVEEFEGAYALAIDETGAVSMSPRMREKFEIALC